uniref:Rhodanese domain-containing protein n=1 Tax=Chromera velia CCMP2878 TaxID=1169474 RepID=A0A0G4HDS5_9ALVE|eukprot:Cvel_26431.t1-p1 / transcript=Cvel_26431.t1 / gene=Cvel_26431 / organism=Chromera_velia_CCMP2878 / gene_product=3-mercaptopyruvate sulfurtransferase, putative / transcript_product=3-mercaptopyruvate sulfurtransferase, putative / location=Cvel_scaffold3139:1962-4985(+) / protein_length=324 / sequence_SO=supercontig / SO=protein_coding / is_pseudo=false
MSSTAATAAGAEAGAQKSTHLTEASPLISTDELERNLGKYKILDATWVKLPMWAGRDAWKEFCESRIPGAFFFDIDEVADTRSEYPHMLPSEEQLAGFLTQHGIQTEDHIVCYDSHGVVTSPRVWWTLKVFGLPNVFVLDGGLKKWKAEGRRTESGDPPKTPSISEDPSVTSGPVKANLKVALQKEGVRSYEEIRALQQKLHSSGDSELKDHELIVDARPRGRFDGTLPEPREGIPSGHFAFSVNLPANEMCDVETGAFLSKEKIRKLAEEQGVDLDRRIICSCGSGITAATVFLALSLLGKTTNISLYDGAWTEWQMRQLKKK